ncbi:MAG TPA: type II toxin-antitoxin system RelE/ParE family toxin [bacterium]|nr:type II toxin-antitoxin system RelE/ParE family toxin [bacterium]
MKGKERKSDCINNTLSDIVNRRVFKTRNFSKWSEKTGLPDEALCRAFGEMVRGLTDADLGGGVVKKRVPLPGRGKRGGARALIATNKNDRWFFVFGFEKKERENIQADELEGLQTMARDLLGLPEARLESSLREGILEEICREK